MDATVWTIILVVVTAILTMIGYLFICMCNEWRGPGPSMGVPAMTVDEYENMEQNEGGGGSQFIVLLPGVTRSKGISSGFGSRKETFDPTAPNIPGFQYTHESREQAEQLVEAGVSAMAEADEVDDGRSNEDNTSREEGGTSTEI